MSGFHAQNVECEIRQILEGRGLCADSLRSLQNGHYAKNVFEFNGTGNGNGESSHVVKMILVANCNEETGMDYLTNLIKEYRQKLTEYHVPIVQIHWLYPKRMQHGYYIIEIAEHGGKTIEPDIRQKIPVNAIQTIADTLDTVSQLFQADKDHLLPVGLNFAPRNFTRSKKGELYYIDYFYPYVPPLLCWPQPEDELRAKLEQWRHYDVRGLMQVFLTHVARIRPELYFETDRLIAKRMQEWKLGTVTWWNNRNALRLNAILESHRAKWNKKARRFLGKLQVEQVYDLRDCAAVLASRGVISRDLLEQVFESTHFDSHAPLDPKKFMCCRGSLVQAISSL